MFKEAGFGYWKVLEDNENREERRRLRRNFRKIRSPKEINLILKTYLVDGKF